MGSIIKLEDVGKEFNDTLKLTYEEGFPEDLKMRGLERDVEKVDLVGRCFNFQKNGRRKFHDETRVFLVQQVEDRWLYWGEAKILHQEAKADITFGRYQITKIYNEEAQKIITRNQAPEGKSYFLGPAFLRGI